MKKALVILLCALAVFAIVSCKQDPPAPEKCTVTFNTEGGPEIAPVTLEKGAKVEKPADPVKVGSYFCGWFKDSKFENEYDFSAAVTESFTLYAKWEEGTIYRVTSLDYTSESGNDCDKFIVSFPDAKVGPGDVVSITFRTTEPFKQYSIRRYGDNKKFFHEKSKGDYPQFFTAMEEGEDGWTTITYVFPEEGAKTQDTEASQYPEGGIGFNVYFRNQKMVPGAYMELKAVAINGKEYTLTEKSVNPDGSLGNVDSYFEVISWIPRTVSFDTDGGTVIPDVAVPYGQPVAQPADPEKEDVMFYGWYADEDLEEEFDFGTLIFKDTTIYAKYAPPVEVTFDTDGGSEIKPVIIPQGYAVDEPADPTKPEQRFMGWFSDEECETAYDFDTPVMEDITLYALWLPVYVVTLDYNDGSQLPREVYVLRETGKIDANALRTGNPGFFLDGWYTKATGGEKINIAEYTVTADMTIYAHWTEPEVYYKLTATKGTDGIDDHKYDQDKFTLYWNPNTAVNPGDVLSIAFKPVRTDEMTEGRPFTYSIRDKKKWFSEKEYGKASYPQFWSTFEADEDGWIYATYVFPESGTQETITYPATFRIDFRDTKIASPTEGRIADVLYIKGMALNGVALTLDEAKTGDAYCDPTIEPIEEE